LESRRQRVTRNRTRSLNKKPVVQNSADLATLLPNIAELIEDGDITLGRLHPIGCVATAADEDRCLAMLVRHRGETLGQLLTRLDRAIGTAINEDIFTDEINPPPTTHS
jgi:hypothetical protein